MQQANITKINGGGFMVNYKCSASCAHCMYSCSPKWPNEYMSQDLAAQLSQTAKKFGLNHIHIGGGEPFLDYDGLLKVVKEIRNQGIAVDFIETNAAWCVPAANPVEKFAELRETGVSGILISLDPFHNEYVPLERVINAANACREAGMYYWLWKRDFMKEISALDADKVHSLKEYEEKFGNNYVPETIRYYGLRAIGRAASLVSEYYKLPSTEEILKKCTPCTSITDTYDIHFDVYGKYIPGDCTTLRIETADLGKPLDINKYQLITKLYNEGPAALLDEAKQTGFELADSYSSKCHLCIDILNWFSQKGLHKEEIAPKEFFENRFYKTKL